MRGMKAVPVIQKTQIKKKTKHINKLLQKFTAKFPKCISGKLVIAALTATAKSLSNLKKEGKRDKRLEGKEKLCLITTLKDISIFFLF